MAFTEPSLSPGLISLYTIFILCENFPFKSCLSLYCLLTLYPCLIVSVDFSDVALFAVF